MSSELYEFITKSAKSREFKLDDLARACDFSRSALWRYMKGKIPITPEAEKVFADTLKLNVTERDTFHALIASAENDAYAGAWDALDALLFGVGTDSSHSGSTLVLYDNDRFLRTPAEIFDLVLRRASEQGFVCRIQIVGDVHGEMLADISKFLHKLLPASEKSRADQIIFSSDGVHMDEAEAFISAIPFLQYENYNLLTLAESGTDAVPYAFGHSVCMDCSYVQDGAEKSELFMIAIRDVGRSSCIRTEDPNVRRFLLDGFDEILKNCVNSCHDFRNIDAGTRFFMDFESEGDLCLIKDNPCYNMIPLDVWQTMAVRIGPEAVHRFAESFVGRSLSPDETESVVAEILAGLGERVAHSFSHRHTEVYSRSGLRTFAETGMISDHFDSLPPFSKDEIQRILEYLIGRSADENDSYRLHITDGFSIREMLVIMAVRGDGVIIEYDTDGTRESLGRHLYIDNKKVADVFCGYAEKHIPATQAAPESEAVAYIKELIETCG
jgi:transcriptional regulator with XRE-family HTH domain